MTITGKRELQWLDAQYGAAVIYAIAILRSSGMSSPEFKAGENTARDLWIRLCECQSTSLTSNGTSQRPISSL